MLSLCWISAVDPGHSCSSTEAGAAGVPQQRLSSWSLQCLQQRLFQLLSHPLQLKIPGQLHQPATSSSPRSHPALHPPHPVLPEKHFHVELLTSTTVSVHTAALSMAEGDGGDGILEETPPCLRLSVQGGVPLPPALSWHPWGAR